MPRDITHVILADEAAKLINDKDILNNPDALHMGSIAVDTFFYSLSSKFSQKMHGKYETDTRVVVLDMVRRLKEERDPVNKARQKAFICGYLCHVAADSVFHPLINSVSYLPSKENNFSGSDEDLATARHRYAETWLDLYFLKDKNLSFDNFRPFRKVLTNIELRSHLDYCFANSCYRTLGGKTYNKVYTWRDSDDLQAEFHNSMTRQFFVDKVTQNSTIAEMLNRLDKIMNGRLKPFTSGFYGFCKDIPQQLVSGSFVHPITKRVVYKSIDDLEYDAVMRSVDFIKAVNAYIQSGDKKAFLNAVPNVNLDTGIVTPNVNVNNSLLYVAGRNFASNKGEYKSAVGSKEISLDVPNLMEAFYSKSR